MNDSTLNNMAPSQWIVVDHKVKGTMISLDIGPKDISHERGLMKLEIEFNWRAEKMSNGEMAHRPVFVSAFLTGLDGYLYGMDERAASELAGDWESLIE